MTGVRGRSTGLLRSHECLLSLMLLVGCRRSPSFNVLGSFFPGWIACIAAGVLIAGFLRWLITRVGFSQYVPLQPLFYFSLGVLIACTLWLIMFA